MLIRMLSLMGFLALLGGTAYAQEATSPDTTQADAVVYMKGLSCEKCAESVSIELKRVEGVAKVKVLLEKPQRALLTIKEGAEVTEKALRKAVERAGFQVERIAFRPPKSS